MAILVCMSSLVLVGMFGWAGRRPSGLGVQEGRLRSCPDSPNCVSSQATDALHGISSIAFEGDPDLAMARIQRVLEATPRMKIVKSLEGYIHAEATSRLLRFVDDVEVLIDSQAKVLHMRSASRVGYSDMGVNRKRLEQLRTAFDAQQR